MNVPYTDYGARMLDKRYRLDWLGVDALAEITPDVSPFAFCNNNPIRYVDHFGLSATDTLANVNIAPVEITGSRGSSVNTLAYYALPMVSFNDDAKQAAQQGRWGAYAGNMFLGALDGFLFTVTLGQSSSVTGPLKIAAKTAARATLKRTLKLTPERLSHIINRHWATSKIPGKSKFLPGMDEKKLVEMVKTTIEKGVAESNTKGRPGTIYIYDFMTTIGTTRNGANSSVLKVVVENNEIITAYPYF